MQLFLIRDYHKNNFDFIWINVSKVKEGGARIFIQLENALNCQGEIGLNRNTFNINTILSNSGCIQLYDVTFCLVFLQNSI